MVQRGPFRSCDSASYASFLRDIMDGYFPSEFRGAHPDGVFLDLVDRSGQVYTPGCPDDVSARMDKDQLLRRLPKTVIRKGQVDIHTYIHPTCSQNCMCICMCVCVCILAYILYVCTVYVLYVCMYVCM